jgi:outer membrane protein
MKESIMSKLLRIGLLGIGLVMLLGSAAAAQRFAFIDSDKIQANYKEWQKAQETFNTEYKAWEDQAATMDSELQQMMADYDKQKLILSADKKIEREAAINAKQEALNSFTREISSPGGKAERRMNELVKPLYDKITAAIEKVAIEENYDFVFNSNGLAYAKKDLDITDKVLDILENEE